MDVRRKKRRKGGAEIMKPGGQGAAHRMDVLVEGISTLHLCSEGTG
jgi:hypothetical protein